MQLIIIREAYVDSPDRVVVGGRDDIDAALAKFYPGAVRDSGGFTTPDGGSYLLDVVRADQL
ncbi:hypothetical protein HOT45_gp35 [Gordonia phage Trine]|uniref:Uncharacterized protein n=1 Tax=Gordonia phage Trine TaxID=2201431 RepID=A0A2Z4Q8Y7_9CAUD|nr:hypothetical protein HOT45_gp35 [Gordonia phage Trine]AWY06537.1 hypothetical protein PBI_TRINE_35 [Gordonia phage Trine]